MPAVVQGVRFFLAHAPGLVRHGSKPARELAKDPSLDAALTAHLRSWEDAAGYAPNQVFLGGLAPETLAEMPRPWTSTRGDVRARYPHGQLAREEALLGMLRLADQFGLVRLEEGFAREAAALLAGDPDLPPEAAAAVEKGESLGAIEAELADAGQAIPLVLPSGRLVGAVRRGHEEDATLASDVLLENLASKATAAMAARALLRETGVDPTSVEYVINAGEEAVGDRYQRGGGNLAKAVAEMSGCSTATGSDVKAFCCGPVHALVIAAALVQAGLYRRVLVVGGAALAKLGMKFRGHLAKGLPIVEDVLAGAAVLVGPDDGRSPIIRLDAVGRHPVGAGGSQQHILEALVEEPLKRLGLGFADIDTYATELHNPEATEPAGSGNVPLLNYRLIGALAIRAKQLDRTGLDGFVARHGLPGFAPTQGHIASALPFLAHAYDRLTSDDRGRSPDNREGPPSGPPPPPGHRGGPPSGPPTPPGDPPRRIRRAMFLAKGSLFLGRMTQMSDGLSFILERNG